MNTASIIDPEIDVYLGLALIWLAIGIVIQAYWTTLQPRMMIPVDRTVMGFICFIMFSYCFIRWRLGRMREHWHEQIDEPPPPRPRRREPIDPTFDFSDSEPNDESKQRPPAS